MPKEIEFIARGTTLTKGGKVIDLGTTMPDPYKDFLIFYQALPINSNDAWEKYKIVTVGNLRHTSALLQGLVYLTKMSMDHKTLNPAEIIRHTGQYCLAELKDFPDIWCEFKNTINKLENGNFITDTIINNSEFGLE